MAMFHRPLSNPFCTCGKCKIPPKTDDKNRLLYYRYKEAVRESLCMHKLFSGESLDDKVWILRMFANDPSIGGHFMNSMSGVVRPQTITEFNASLEEHALEIRIETVIVEKPVNTFDAGYISQRESYQTRCTLRSLLDKPVSFIMNERSRTLVGRDVNKMYCELAAICQNDIIEHRMTESRSHYLVYSRKKKRFERKHQLPKLQHSLKAYRTAQKFAADRPERFPTRTFSRDRIFAQA